MYTVIDKRLEQISKRIANLRVRRLNRIQEYRIFKKWNIKDDVPRPIHPSTLQARNNAIRLKLYSMLRKSRPSHCDEIRNMIYVYTFDQLLSAAMTMKSHAESKAMIYAKNKTISNEYREVVVLCDRIIEIVN